MSTHELMKEIQRLPIGKRLMIVQKALFSIQQTEQQQMKMAADLLWQEYTSTSQLTSFTSLDSEPFYG